MKVSINIVFEIDDNLDEQHIYNCINKIIKNIDYNILDFTYNKYNDVNDPDPSIFNNIKTNLAKNIEFGDIKE